MSCKAFHKGKYYVAFKRGFEDCKKDVTVTIDKVFETDSLVSKFVYKHRTFQCSCDLCHRVFYGNFNCRKYYCLTMMTRRSYVCSQLPVLTTKI